MRGVIIVNCTQCLRGYVTDAYQTGRALTDVGILPGYLLLQRGPKKYFIKKSETKFQSVLVGEGGEIFTHMNRCTGRRAVSPILRCHPTMPRRFDCFCSYSLFFAFPGFYLFFSFLFFSFLFFSFLFFSFFSFLLFSPPSFDMTPEAALTKLSYVLGLEGLSLAERKSVSMCERV